MAFYTKRESYFFKFDETCHKTLPYFETLDSNKELLLSSHKLSGFDNVIGNIDREHYVVCVVYYKNGEMWDTQLGITGSIMRKTNERNSSHGSQNFGISYEDAESGAVRECAEELGLMAEKDYFQNKTESRHFVKTRKTSQTVYTATIDISHCVPYEPDLHSQEIECTAENGWKDDRSQKVQILVHGELNELINKIKDIKHRIPSNDLNSIRGIRLLHQQDVYRGMKYLNNKNRFQS